LIDRLLFYVSLSSLDCSRRGDGDLLAWFSALAANGLDRLDQIHPFHYLAEHNMAAVQLRKELSGLRRLEKRKAAHPGCLDCGDEELGSVGARTCVGHRQETGFAVPEVEVLV